MDTLLQVAGLGLIAVLLGLVLKKGNGVLALLLTLAACAAMTVSIVRLAEPVVSFLSELRQLAGLEPALLQPLLRTVGIGLLTQLTASVCADAGESTVARLIELCGSVLGIYTALPLLEAVLSLLRTMLEGGCKKNRRFSGRSAPAGGSVLAAEPTEALSDVLGADELTQSLPDEAAEVLDGLSPDGTPDFRSGVRSILRAAAGGSGGALRSGLRLCAVLLAMVTLCAVVRMSTQKDPVNAVSAVGALGICAACLGGMQSMISLASETVTRLSDYSACLLPVMASAMAMSGGTVSAGTLYAGTALFSGLLSRLIARLLLPGVSVYLVVAAAEAALADSLLSELREFVGWLISKSLRVVLFVFTGYLTVTGVISGSADAAAVRATKAAVSGMVPVVGSILSDASETLLASASALKSSMGVFGMLAVLAICLTPFLKIGAQYLLLKGTAAVSGTIGMPQQVKLVKHAATAMGYLLAMTGACALMLLISVVCFLKVVG